MYSKRALENAAISMVTIGFSKDCCMFIAIRVYESVHPGREVSCVSTIQNSSRQIDYYSNFQQATISHAVSATVHVILLSLWFPEALYPSAITINSFEKVKIVSLACDWYSALMIGIGKESRSFKRYFLSLRSTILLGG